MGGVVKPGEEVIFLPTHTSSTACTGKVFTVEMHHKRHEQGGPGDNIGMNVKGLDKKNTSLGACANFNAQIQVLDIPGEIKIGYSPIGFVRCGRSACRVSKIVWKIGKE